MNGRRLLLFLFLLIGAFASAQGTDADGVYWEQLTPREKLILITGFKAGVLGVVYLDHGGFVDDKRGALSDVLIRPYQWACNPEKLVKILDEFYRQNGAKLHEDIPTIIMDLSGVGAGLSGVGERFDPYGQP